MEQNNQNDLVSNHSEASENKKPGLIDKIRGTIFYASNSLHNVTSSFGTMGFIGFLGGVGGAKLGFVSGLAAVIGGGAATLGLKTVSNLIRKGTDAPEKNEKSISSDTKNIAKGVGIALGLTLPLLAAGTALIKTAVNRAELEGTGQLKETADMVVEAGQNQSEFTSRIAYDSPLQQRAEALAKRAEEHANHVNSVIAQFNSKGSPSAVEQSRSESAPAVFKCDKPEQASALNREFNSLAPSIPFNMPKNCTFVAAPKAPAPASPF